MYIQYKPSSAVGGRRACQTVLDTNYVYERDGQTISKRDSSERNSGTVRCCKYYEYRGTMERPRSDGVFMAAPSWGCLKQSIDLSGYEAPNCPQSSPDVKRRTDAATMKQISERKRKCPSRQRKKKVFWIGFVPWRKKRQGKIAQWEEIGAA